MITLRLSDIEELEEFEFVVDGQRQITLSFNPKNFSLQIPGGVKSESINLGETSFFLRSPDRN